MHERYKKLAQLHPRHFWTHERGMTGLLISVLTYLLVTCASGDFYYGEIVAHVFFSLVIITGVLATFRQRWVFFLAVFLAVASLVIDLVDHIPPLGSLTTMNAVLSLILAGVLLAVLTSQVFQAGPVTAHRIRGAIVVYLLLGGIWGLLYLIVALNIPGAFRFSEAMNPANIDALQRQLTYFSFITLTTTGYGDITPVHPLARTLAIFEALAGQLYLVITLARLVSLALMEKKADTQQVSD
jgi:hypothetical protein